MVKEVTVDDDDREILNEVTVSNSKNMLLRRQEDILANALSVNSNTSSDGKKEDCVNKEAIMQECCATQSTSEYEEE
ncbi:MAG: hypothetical protein J6A29_06905 [Clostridia bacterium]|nr:hypothetical protein [Clostridia bacterium]